MKPSQYYITVAIGAACLVLGIALIALGQSNQSLQNQLQQNQEIINKGSMSQQVGTNLVRAIGESALNDEGLKKLLNDNGIQIQVTPSGTAAPAAANP